MLQVSWLLLELVFLIITASICHINNMLHIAQSETKMPLFCLTWLQGNAKMNYGYITGA